ncbi:MAG: homocysteine S-methyltransferase family protein [Immundisolibacterales bacterium]|nr:homocysteine S-methyltransferase family protein [Immundisolibacterales bacterium]
MSEGAMQAIGRRLAADEVILLDGATGTELERRGAPMHDEVWCGAATLSHGALLRDIHEDYIRAGASVVIANTYGSNRIMLEPAGLGSEFESINRRAVEIALEARDRAAGGDAIAVAGSMSHMVPMRHDPARAPSPARANECFTEMAQTLADAGVDLIILEMMSNPELARPAVAAALATGLPVWIGYSARRGGRGEPVPFLRPDLDFADMVRAVHSDEVRIHGVMHTNVDLTGPAIDVLRGLFGGPILVYPDSGFFAMPNWQFVNIVSPQELARAARGWIEEHGARLVGGCCGLGVEHIEALAEMIAARRP